MELQVRRAAVAGRFYPGEASELAEEVDGYIAEGRGAIAGRCVAFIAPHAGYVYSGPVAGSAYRALAELEEAFDRVVLLGPSHYVAFEGIAAPEAMAFETPLGSVAVDGGAIEALVAAGLVGRSAEAHRREHGLEVHLPFLQRALGEGFGLVPLVVGQTSATHVAAVIEALWTDARTLVVISSDLSHYLPYAACVEVDAATCAAIEALEEGPLGPSEACGFVPVRGMLRVARQRGLRVQTLDVRNSGDTAGDRSRVVGYGAWVFSDGPVQ